MPWFNAPGQLTGGAWSPGDGTSWAYPQPFVRPMLGGAMGGGALGQISGGLMGAGMSLFGGGGNANSWLPTLLNQRRGAMPQAPQAPGAPPPRESIPPGEGWKGYGGGSPTFNEGSGGWWPGSQMPPAMPPVSMPQPTGPREAPEAHPGMADRGAGQWAAGGWTPPPQPNSPQPMPLPRVSGNIAGNWQGGVSTQPATTNWQSGFGAPGLMTMRRG